MRAIEFEATAHQRMIRIPDSVPDGVTVRVLVLLNDSPVPLKGDLKTLLSGLTEGLTAEDLLRSRDVGREPEWDI
jgi:hypothetical protein